MTIMAEAEPDLARLRPLFVLEKISQRLRSDVLADGSVISACGFTAKRPLNGRQSEDNVRLGDGV